MFLAYLSIKDDHREQKDGHILITEMLFFQQLYLYIEKETGKGILYRFFALQFFLMHVFAEWLFNAT
jgi:hypothetical protein